MQRLIGRFVDWLMARYGEFKALRIIRVIEKAISVIINTFKNWINDEIPLHGAALAFYTIFSLAPLLLIIIALSGVFFGESAATGQLAGFLEDLIGPEAASVIESIVSNADKPFSGILATVVGIGTILFTSTTVIAQLKSSLNTIWNVETREGQSVKQFLISRFTALLIVLLLATILVLTLTLDAVIAIIGVNLEELLPSGIGLISWINYSIFMVTTIFLFATIFKMLPDIKLSWSDALVGATVTTLLFLLGRFLITKYLGTGNIGSTYGAAGTFVVFLIWIYYNSMTVFLGAEFTHQYTITFGKGFGVPKHARVKKNRLHKTQKPGKLARPLTDRSSDRNSEQNPIA
ncbi:MAG: YihY/virulence factor BrkB family protein [Bacteroidetes bacterium]|nr:YihY/virulence factor BrkB family protein [Bacteroidota bacterium]MCH8525337.1 YihY/virulence factor BrkB family protein [Balneolales bacterium]